MKKLNSFWAVLALLTCFSATVVAQSKTQVAVGDTLFSADFKTIPGAFTSGDVYATSATANSSKVENTITFGNGVSSQRINMNVTQSAKTFETGGDYASYTANDDGATNGAFSFLRVGTGTSGGGYFITPAVTGPCEIDVWTCSGNTYSQKYYVYFIENDGTPLLEAATTIIGGRKIKKNTYKYEGTGSLKLKFVCSELQSSTNTNLYFYNIVIKEAALPTTPSLEMLSGIGTQAFYPGQSISPIVYKWSGTATSASVAWTGTVDAATPPTGIIVNADVTAKTLTISGIISNAGDFNYSVTSTDGTNATDPLTGTLTGKTTTKYKLAYVTTVTNGSPAALDAPFLTALSTEFDINYISSTATGVDYSFYDLIILSALPNSGDAGLVELKTSCLSKPFVNMKTYQLQSSRWNWLTPANTTINTIAIPTTELTHPIYTGIVPSGTNSNEIQITTATSGNMAVKVSWLTTTTASANPKVLSTVLGDETASCYMEIPVGTTMNGMESATTAKHLILGLSEAAWGSLTSDAVTLVVNSAKYVVGAPFIINGVRNDAQIIKIVSHKEYFDFNGKKLHETAKGLLIEKTIYKDGSSNFKKIHRSEF